MRTRTVLLAAASALAMLTTMAAVATADTGRAAAPACTVGYATDDWGTGFTATVTLRNLGAEPLAGWQLTWSYAGNQRFQEGWNGTWTQSGSSVGVTAAPWNATVPAGGSVSAGANFTYSGRNDAPAGFALDGTPCTGASPPPTTPPPPPPPSTTTPPPTTAPPGTAPALRVAGNRLVDTAGTPVVLRGVNRSGGEFACVQGWGLFDGPMDAASVAAIAAWRTNAVRVPLNEDCWLGRPNVPAAYGGQPYRDAVRAYVDLLHRHGQVAVLDLHWSRGVYTGNSSACASVDSTCQKPMPGAGAVEFWRSVATTFRGDDATVFDLFNEPYADRAVPGAGAWACWRDGVCPGIGYPVAGMQALVDAVRGTGATNVILLGGLAYANDLTGWLAHRPADPLGNLAASWHSYNFNACTTSACWDATLAARVPLVAGEIGQNDCAAAYVTRLMDWLDRTGASYLGWTWNTWNCGSGPALISSYDGTPTPFGAGIRAHFLSRP